MEPVLSPNCKSVCILLNSKAGTARSGNATQLASAIASPFRVRGDTVSVRVFRPPEMKSHAEFIKASRSFDVVVICGGDGTLSYFADALAGEPLSLAFIPLGTMNFFARAIQVPFDPVDAASSIAAGSAQMVDVGTVNGQLFLHHVSFGVHAKLVRQRRDLKYGSRWGKMVASIRAFFLVIRRPPLLKLNLTLDDSSERQVKASSLVVSNNLFGEGHLPFPDDLKRGQLGIYHSQSHRWSELIMLAVDFLSGQLRNNPNVTVKEARRLKISISSPGKRFVRASVDGENNNISLPVTVEIKPQTLSVIIPKVESEHA